MINALIVLTLVLKVRAVVHVLALAYNMRIHAHVIVLVITRHKLVIRPWV